MEAILVAKKLNAMSRGRSDCETAQILGNHLSASEHVVLIIVDNASFWKIFWPKFTKYRISYLILFDPKLERKVFTEVQTQLSPCSLQTECRFNTFLDWVDSLFIYLFYILEATSMFYTILDSGSKAVIFLFFYLCVCVLRLHAMLFSTFC